MNRVLTTHRAELEQLCRHHHVHRLELFGSAAAGSDRPGESDLDFLVEFEPMPSGSYADAYFGLLESLEALLGRPVDLVVPSAIKNPYFRQAVEQTKALVYAA
ncbi:MAG: hypothetical protein EPO26_16885 [Chloroflexota bacterium]|nr:MAG: hypothetical protein EPO26_16885 [Chloroflexota bacterium]